MEDQPALRDKIQEVLETSGYQVIPAPDGDHAYRSSGRPNHTFTATDVVMPEMSGFRLAERLQALRPFTKVLYMSGYPTSGNVRTDLVSLPNFIPKPFTREGLLRMVRDILDGNIPQCQRSTIT